MKFERRHQREERQPHQQVTAARTVESTNENHAEKVEERENQSQVRGPSVDVPEELAHGHFVAKS